MPVLIVKESAAIRHQLEAQLRAAGHGRVFTAPNFSEALALIGGGVPPGRGPTVDLVLMDVTMPDMDGVAACGILRSTPQLSDIPVILLSDQHESAQLEAAFDAGAFDYVPAPFRTTELLARIRSALRFKAESDKFKARERDHARAVEELKRMSSEDALTAVANRGRFDDVLASEVRTAVRHRSLLSLLMIDVDEFKKYNDHHGHTIGDMCLQFVAIQVKQTLRRSTDLAARYGGEEFAVILPDTHAAGALAVAERIRARVERLQLPHPRSAVARVVTVSVGAVSFGPAHTTAPTKFVRAADRQLYLAKAAGRNRVSATATLEVPDEEAAELETAAPSA